MDDISADALIRSGVPLDGRYVLKRRLGGGGMADVYRADDLVLRRSVAVKILKRELAADAELAERFRLEAQAAAQVSHPNIVTVYDRGSAGEAAYIVMEDVRGETLKERLRAGGALAPAEAVRIALAVLAALEAAHGRRIVHRDVTSGNVLLDEGGGVKVADFGIARLGTSALTRTGTLLGTSSYLSPEQAQGQRADERSDLYSLGVVLYEMLTGSLPFTGDNDVAIAVQHISTVPPDPRALVAGLPAGLVASVLKALSKDPDDRYQSAAEFTAALTRLEEPAAEEATRRVPAPVPAPYAGEGAGPASSGELETVAWALSEAPTRAGAEAPAEDTREHRPAPVASRRRLWRRLGIVLAILAVAGASWAVWTALNTGVEVPGVEGRSQDAAVAAVTERGLKPSVRKEWVDGTEAGDVARQRPVAETKVEEGAEVDLWVSRGPLHIPAPDVVGMAAADAGGVLQAQALRPRQRRAASETAPEGQIFRQKPVAGVQVARGDMVTFWVSSGPPLVSVPDVVGIESGEAVNVLEAEGFVVSIDFVFGWGEDPGYVVGQDPAAGERLRHGDEVVIEVAVF